MWTVDHTQSSEVEGLRKESGGLMTLSRTWHSPSHQLSGVGQIMPHQEGWTPLCECPNISSQVGEFYNWASWEREDIGRMRSTIPPPQCLLIISLPCLALTPVCCLIKVVFSWSSSSDHLFCTWAVPLHTVSKGPAVFVNGQLSYWPLTFQSQSYTIAYSLPVHNFSSKSWELHLAQFQNKVVTNPDAQRYSTPFLK